MKTLLFMLEEMCSITDSFSFTQSLQPSSYHQEPRRIYKPGYDGKRVSAERHLTSLKTGLLLFTSLTLTITSAKLLRGVGPPDTLSSMAVMFRMYCGPLRRGSGLRRSLMIPEFGSKVPFYFTTQTNKKSQDSITFLCHCVFGSVWIFVAKRRIQSSLNHISHHIRSRSPRTKAPNFGDIQVNHEYQISNFN